MQSNSLALVYHPGYNLDLGPHVFPARKFALIYNAVKENSYLSKLDVLLPEPATEKDLRLVHTRSYIKDFLGLKVTDRTKYSELPLNESIIQSFMLAVGGTIRSIELTEKFRYVYHIGGGFHHSFPDKAEGFCYLNDAAVGVRKFQKKHPKLKVLFIDLDLHQGNGNAYVFRKDSNVYTFSMHQEDIYPRKEQSNLDIGLEAGIKDKEYLAILADSLSKIESEFIPDLIIYVAGADPFEKDTLGDLKISMRGLKDRDKQVKEFADKLHAKVVVLPAGGYAQNFQDTVRIHFQTIQIFGESK